MRPTITAIAALVEEQEKEKYANDTDAVSDVDAILTSLAELCGEGDKYLTDHEFVEYVTESIASGVSRDLIAGLSIHGDVYELIPTLPNIDQLPFIRNIDDTHSVLALESVAEMAQKFWEWVRGVCAKFTSAVQSLTTAIYRRFEDLDATISKHAKAIAGVNIDANKLNTTTAELIPYTSHRNVMKILPNLTSELVITAKGVELSDWRGKVSTVLKILGIGAVPGVIAGSHVSDKVVKPGINKVAKKAYKGIRSAEDTVLPASSTVPGGKILRTKALNQGFKAAKDNVKIVRKASHVSSTALTSALMTAGIGTALVLATKLPNWIKMGCQINTNGMVDMTPFNDNLVFKAKEGTVANLGWEQKNTVNGNDVRQLLNLVTQTNKAAIGMVKATKQLEKDVQSELKKYTDSSSLMVARKVASRQVSGALSTQKLANSMLIAITKLARNFLAAQKAVLSCKL